MIVCFDVDGTLIDENDQPVPEMVELAQALIRSPGVDVVIWSGGGRIYAHHWRDKLGLLQAAARAKDKTVWLPGMPMDKGQAPDIVIDDEAGWGKLQLIVKRGNGPVVL